MPAFLLFSGLLKLFLHGRQGQAVGVLQLTAQSVQLLSLAGGVTGQAILFILHLIVQAAALLLEGLFLLLQLLLISVR